MIDNVPRDLSPNEAAGMTVNERLWVSGLMEQFDSAVKRKDTGEITEILKKVYLDQSNIDAVIAVEFEKK